MGSKKNVTLITEEELTDNIIPEEKKEGHLYMEANTRTQDVLEMYKQQIPELYKQQIPCQSSKQIQDQQSKEAVFSSFSKFQWPRQSRVAEEARSSGSSIDKSLEEKLKECGILRKRTNDETEEKFTVDTARISGSLLTKKQVRLSFDTFLAKSRPGLESDEEVKESPKPRKIKNKNRNKKDTELPVFKSWHDDKEKKIIRTSGWDNPAWRNKCPRIVRPDNGASLVRAF